MIAKMESNRRERAQVNSVEYPLKRSGNSDFVGSNPIIPVMTHSEGGVVAYSISPIGESTCLWYSHREESSSTETALQSKRWLGDARCITVGCS